MKLKYRHLLLIIVVILTSIKSFAQSTENINSDLLNKPWQAKWITCPGISGNEFGVYLFRKTFTLNSETKQFIIHVSADNRYKLYVNEKYISNGPERGDLLKWHFDSFDIAPYLKQGENIITALVWNFAEERPVAQFTNQTGFILQGNTSTESIVNTDKNWHISKDSAYTSLPVRIPQYYAVGPRERFNSESHPWGWLQASFDDSSWKKAKELSYGTPLKSFKEYGETSQYILYPRDIPQIEEKPQRFIQIRRSDLPGIPENFLTGKQAITIPSHSKIKILFDQNNLTNAYPVLKFSKGKNSEIKLTYAESLVNDKSEKGNRNEIHNKKIVGTQDNIISDGGENRTYQTLWWRTFRYLELEIETKDEPLTIIDFYSIFTGYPLTEKATFKCNDSALTDIWNVGWRTQRLCAGETFFDCPYYEQLQYAGDTRIQNLVSSYVSGDFTMMKNAVASLHDSHMPFGLTQSRYPGYVTQIIPPFSLIWITMVHDYWMMNEDKSFTKSMIPGILDVLNWYESKIDSTGMLGRMEWWNFVDWVNYKNWNSGTPPGINTSNSSIISLQYVYTLEKASTLLNAYNFKDPATRYLKLAESIKSAVYKTCFDKQRGLLADTPDKLNYSQHANILAILTNTIAKELQPVVMKKILNEKDIAQCSYYFRFYLAEANEKAGLSEGYLEMLDPWKQMLDNGLTTFAEQPDPTRSDCHAWSASPVYYFLSLVCGIKPNEPGFKSVRIEPHMGQLNWIEGTMPHRLGTISLKLKKDKQNNITGEVSLPKNLTGFFIMEGLSKPLKSGINPIRINK
ncbi:MAG: alpha-L-rhamnosidase N-terminal domain-containing protein [Bacteroidetes bacterium]|nr:alpha-L-rhamnosidase N-terminal domain-containing protein [Bacteroidota bacterium]